MNKTIKFPGIREKKSFILRFQLKKQINQTHKQTGKTNYLLTLTV